MKRNCCLFVVVVFFLAHGLTLQPQSKVFANKAIECMLSCQYAAAIQSCDSLVRNNTDAPLGWMLLLSTIALQDLDCAAESDTIGFFTVLKKTEDCIAAYEFKNGKNSYSLTMRGFSRAVAAAYCLQHKSYMKGLNLGLDGIGILKDAKKMDPGNYDADFFLGMYTYARADLKQMFWWALFWYPGEKTDGIKALLLCRRNASFCSLAAHVLLAEFYTREQNYDAAYAIIYDVSTRYPQSRFIQWSRAKMFEAKKSYKEAAASYGMLADSYDTIPSAYVNSMTARYKQASMAYLDKDMKTAYDLCGIVLKKSNHNDNADCKKVMRDAKKLQSTIAQMQ